MTQGERPKVAAAHIYVLGGKLTDEDLDKIRGYLINPVDSREASPDKPETLDANYAIPTTVETVEGFISMDEAALQQLLTSLGLAMDLDDLKFLPELLCRRGKARPDHHRGSHDRHLLVGSLPSHDVPDRNRQRQYRGPDGKEGL